MDEEMQRRPQDTTEQSLLYSDEEGVKTPHPPRPVGATNNHSSSGSGESKHRSAAGHHPPNTTAANLSLASSAQPRTDPCRCFARLAFIVVLLCAITVVVVLIVLHNTKQSLDDAMAGAPAGLVARGCDHPVFCQGPLLRAVQLSGVFHDNKYFVDMPIRSPHTPTTVLDDFHRDVLRGRDAAIVDWRNESDVIEAFVNTRFAPPDDLLVPVIPPDYNASPAFLANITDPELRQFAKNVTAIWPQLVRTFNLTAYCTSCVSALGLRHPFVAPGGRFREFYYWDSYWILRGLLVSGLEDTAWNVLDNIAGLIEEFGFMPNGARRYYLNRSQPPLFSLMVQEFVEWTGGWSTEANQRRVRHLLPAMERERTFWESPINTVRFCLEHRDGQQPCNASDPANTVLLYRYNAWNEDPRPESYREDLATWEELMNLTTAASSSSVNHSDGGEAGTAPGRTSAELYSDIAAGAETGWDFSTRWFQPGTRTMPFIITSRIVPVDLNIIMLMSTEAIVQAATAVGANATATHYGTVADRMRDTLVTVLRWSNFSDVVLTPTLNATPAALHAAQWSSDAASAAVWVATRREGFYASIAAVCWARSICDRLSDAERADIAERISLDVAGVPTSHLDSGQQWDYPDAWPPLQFIGVQALEHAHAPAKKTQLVERWVQTNYCHYREFGAMLEKYNASCVGCGGHGGEYTLQLGFGWTNGVILDFLNTHGRSLAQPVC